MPMHKLAVLAALALIAAAPPSAVPEVGEPGTAAERAALMTATKTWFDAQDHGKPTSAYKLIGPSMTAYLTPQLFADAQARFASEAGKLDRRVLTRISWYRDPPDAPAPGLYVATDFTALYANLDLMCGYLMWHEAAPGRFELVREEQNYIDHAAAKAMPPERRKELPKLFGCVGADQPASD
ncbi:DUF4019 domain-containing protein [Sphingomonas montanisoli]|nr:DUF4019 domain-containing protein [Sphingomonas montanisoli]